MASWVDLEASKSKQLPSFQDPINRLNRNLSQIEETSRRLAQKGERFQDQGSKNKAAAFLSALKGFDVGKYKRALSTWSETELPSRFSELDGGEQLDVQAFLRHQHEQIILLSIEEAKKETEKRFTEAHQSHVLNEWDQQRKLLITHWLHSLPTPSLPQALSTPQSTPVYNSSSTPGYSSHPSPSFSSLSTIIPASSTTRRMTKEMIGYAEVVVKYHHYNNIENNFNNQNTSNNLLSGFLSVNQLSPSSLSHSPSLSELSACWCLLYEMLSPLSPVRQSSPSFRTPSSIPASPSITYHKNRREEREEITKHSEEEEGTETILEQQQQLLFGSISFLEKQYSGVLHKVVTQNPQQARIGGVPGVLSLVKAFLSLRYANSSYPLELRGELVNDVPFWAQLYYCFRCGDIESCEKLIKEFLYAFSSSTTTTSSSSSSSAPPPPSLEYFLPAFREYVSTNIVKDPSHLWNELRYAYKTGTPGERERERRAQDPYKLAMYNIISRWDANVHPSYVFSTTQDFMWFKLKMIHPSTFSISGFSQPITLTPGFRSMGDRERERERERAGAVAGGKYTLGVLQRMISEQYGAEYFNKNSSTPLLYFQILLLTQQFQLAIQHLLDHESFSVSAVHFAIIIYHYGLLKQPGTLEQSTPSKLTPLSSPFHFPQSTPSSSSSSRGHTPTHSNKMFNPNDHSIFFEQLLRHYVNIFALSDPNYAAHYYSLLRAQGVKRNLMKELLLQTRQFDFFLGSINNLETKRGLFSSILSNEDIEWILQSAATDTELSGHVDLSISLLLRCGNYNRLLSLLNNSLSQLLPFVSLTWSSSLSLSLSALSSGLNRDTSKYQSQTLSSDRERIRQTAQETEKYLTEFSESLDKKTLRTFELLLLLYTFFDLLAAERFLEALTVMERDIQLIPMHDSELGSKVQSFQTLDSNITRNFSEIMLALMETYYFLYSYFKSQSQTSNSSEALQYMDNFRRKAKTLVMFSGMIQFRIPSDINSRLLRIEVLMN